MFKNLFWVVTFLIIAGFVGTSGWNVYSQLYSIPSNSPSGEYVINVEAGQDLDNVAEKLAADKVITSSQGLIWQSKLNSFQALQKGEYKLKLPAKPEEIISQLNTQTIEKLNSSAKETSRPVVKLTFIEGENLDQMIAKLDKAGIATKADLEEFARSSENFDQVKYPFLPPKAKCEYGDITKCAKYYVEGYLYPDTYNFSQPSTPKEVYEKMLNNFNTKVWSKVRDQAQGKDFHKIVIMASVMEKESGRNKGVTADTIDELNEERKLIASVFYNRLDQGIKWQSDVTAEYGTGRKLCQQTFKIENCMFLDAPATNHLYNTYRVAGYPVGPVTNPQFDNINAALNPTESDYIYFIADVVGKKYFASNETGRQRILAQVNRINRELGL